MEQNQPLGCPILVPAVSVLETKGDQLSSSVVAEPVERPSLSPEQLRKLMSEPDLIHPQALTDAQAAFLALRMWFLSKEYGAVAHESFGSIPHKIEDIKGLRVDPKEVTDLRGALIEYSRRPWLVLSRNQGCGPQLYLLAQLKGIKQISFDPYFSRFLGVGSLEKDLLRYVQERPGCSRLQKSAKWTLLNF